MHQNKNQIALASFDDLMAMKPGSGNVAESLAVLGLLVDASFAQSDLSLRLAGTERAFEWAKAVGNKKMTDAQKLKHDYFQANAWANRAGRAQDREAAWAWDNETLLHQIYFLRRAIANTAFAEAETIRRCQILTNLGNALNTVGRFVEAHEYWNRALAIEPRFWMALGNRGCSRIQYAGAFYSDHQREELLWCAYRDLKRTLALVEEFPFGSEGAIEYFEWHINALSKNYGSAFFEEEMQFLEYSLGRSKEEKRYRQWALNETLFLNVLNDLGTFTAAASDPLHLPAFIVPMNEPPVLIGFFNQLKQEYASARWLLFEAIDSPGPHFSDREIYLLDTMDHPVYGLSAEKLKLAFRSTYSIFDKIAYFLNSYLQIGIPSNQVNFRNIWQVKTGKTSSLRPEFEGMENWPFRGLYWLSKDLFDTTFSEITEPDARDVNDDRNHLEHKYFKLHETVGADLVAEHFIDTMARSSSQVSLEKKCLRLLKLSRAALIYLACGMSARERIRRETTATGDIASMALPKFRHRPGI